MKILKTYKFNDRLLLHLDTDLPKDFKNNSKLLIDGKVYFNALIPMYSNGISRKYVSVKFEENFDLIGKEVIVIN